MQKVLKKVMAYVMVFAMTLGIVGSYVNGVNAATTSVSITESGGWFETAYAKWSPVTNADGYKAYYKASAVSSWTQIDDALIRTYASYVRVDAVGLSAGTYDLKIVPVINGAEDTSKQATKTGITVKAHDRSGYAFSSSSTFGTGSGAYNNNGTLKSGAQIVYVTKDTAKTCTATVNGTKVTGFQSILDAKQKKNTSNDIICFRIIGCVTKNDLDHISSSSEGLQIKGSANYTQMNITIEGIGDDACISGFGMLIRNCGNVEVRNLGILNFMDDGISIDTANCNLWIHNCDFFYGNPGGDADQAKGDGSLDIKKSRYITLSYNHFWDAGKCCLLDAGAGTGESASNYITYHHNWFDHSDSRHPRIRNASAIHVYNNYYDGVSKYGVGTTTGSSAFVEANYFRNTAYAMLISKQGSDLTTGDDGKGTFSGESGGMIKAFGNVIVGGKDLVTHKESATSFDYYEASSRNETVPSTYKTLLGGTTYSNFDTASDFYSYTADSATVAKANVEKYAGRMNGGDLKWTFSSSEDTNYGIISGLKSAVTGYTSKVVSIGSLEEVSSGSNSSGGSSGGSNEEPTTTGSSQGGGPVVVPSLDNFVADVTHNYTTQGKTSTFFNITGNLSTSKGTITFNGLTLTQCLKIESSTQITFTMTKPGALLLVLNPSNSGSLKIDGSEKLMSNDGTILVGLSAGTHTVIKKSGGNLYYMAIDYEETSGGGADEEPPTTGNQGGSNEEPTTTGNQGGSNEEPTTTGNQSGSNEEPTTTGNQGGSNEEPTTANQGDGSNEEPTTASSQSGSDEDSSSENSTNETNKAPASSSANPDSGDDGGVNPVIIVMLIILGIIIVGGGILVYLNAKKNKNQSEQ
ncbi:MAG: pectate lyase [Lachnospira sp.]|nr:pectate lyase [Lachnospira sp.]